MRRTSFRASKGNHPLFYSAEPVYVTPASRLCYNNNDNCDERQIAETTITLLNRDVSRLLEIHSGRFTRERLNERTVPSANRDDS